MWIGVKDENANMLAGDVYNAFLLLPLFMGMFYKTDLRIHGCVSKRLYKNVMNYLQRIMCDFSDDLSPVKVIVDGFREAEADSEQGIIGTGISCGVDSLSTIYDRFVNETDPDYRINTLFFFSSGQHGEYGDEAADRLFLERFRANKIAADKLGLPAVMIDTNLHSFFMGRFGGFCKTAFFAFYSCILALERGIRKYYISSSYSYGQMLKFGSQSRENDFSEFAEPYALPLIRTDNIEFIPEGSQYTREEKLEKISDWKIAQEHLNVCFDHYPNCSQCSKCVRTLMPIEAMGKLEDFSGVFSIDVYKKAAFTEKCLAVLGHDTNGFIDGYYNFCMSHGMKLPSVAVALLAVSFKRPGIAVKYIARALLGTERYNVLKRRLKRR